MVDRPEWDVTYVLDDRVHQLASLLKEYKGCSKGMQGQVGQYIE